MSHLAICGLLLAYKINVTSVTKDRRFVGIFTFFELYIMIYICNKNQQNAHFLR